MFVRNDIKGIGYALLATLAGSTVYIFSKAALNQISLFQFGVYWFAMALIWNGVFAAMTHEHRKIKSITRNSLKVLLLVGLIELVATGTFYWAISIADNAAIPSFLRNMEYIFVALLGVILLGEKFLRIEVLGVVLTLVGVIVISYHKDASLMSYFAGCSGLMVISTSFYAVRTITAKKHIATVTPIMLALNRALFLFLFSFVLLFAFDHSFSIPLSALANIAIGSLLGPFLTSFGQYNALKYIEASKAAVIQSTTALFVLIGAYLYFGRLPLGYQIAGGILTIAGAALLVLGKKLMRQKVN
jgi:drug/metabolite transporter (DMT)-like permease